MLRAAVVSRDAKRRASLRICLEQTGLAQAVMEWTPSTEPSSGIEDWVPPVILLDVAQGTEETFAFAAQLRRTSPSTCIVACSFGEIPDSEMLMQAMRCGVREIIDQPIQPLALRETLLRLLNERGAMKKPADEKLIVVMGAKGGVGATTVAVNVGTQLATLTRKRVVLLDFAQPLGHSTLLLDLQPRFSLRDAIENLDRLDGHFLNGLVTRHKSGLEVLAGPTDPDEWHQIPVSQLSRIISVAQTSCHIPVVDLGAACSSAWVPILKMAHAVVVVAQADVPSLWTLERRLATMAALGLDPERFRIVINRWHRTDEETLRAFERRTKRPIFARLPNDFRQVMEAVNSGVPLTRNHNDPLGTRMKDLASRLGGVSPAIHPKRSSILGLFSNSTRS